MNYLKLGTIIKTRGLKGQVKVYSTTEFAYDRYEKGAIVFLENPETRSMKEFEVESYSNDGQFDYLTFKGYNTIESITPYIRHDILISKEENCKKPSFNIFFFCIVFEVLSIGIIAVLGMTTFNIFGVQA